VVCFCVQHHHLSVCLVGSSMSWLACMEKSMDIDDVLNLHDATSLYVFKWLVRIKANFMYTEWCQNFPIDKEIRKNFFYVKRWHKF
jgi:hypothetical protein